QFPARQDLRLEYSVRKKNAFANGQLAAWADQCFPLAGACLLGQQNLHVAGEVFPAGSVGGWLGVHSCSMPEQAGRDHPGVVENQKLVTLEEVRELGEGMVLKGARLPTHRQKARGVSPRERALGNQLRREAIVEFVEAHGLIPSV